MSQFDHGTVKNWDGSSGRDETTLGFLHLHLPDKNSPRTSEICTHKAYKGHRVKLGSISSHSFLRSWDFVRPALVARPVELAS